MFLELKRYQEYRPSGALWLPRIPAHWASPRLKTVVTETNVKGFPDEPLLAATQSHGVILKTDYEARTVEAQKSLETLKLVDVDDFVISLRSFQGGIERAHARGIISPAYTILTAVNAENRDYLTLLFKSTEFIDALKLTVTGIREGQNIDYSRLAPGLVPLPPADEQTANVKYLGHAHARIDRAISAKRKLIALLEEQKQSIIHRAVTLGIDPAVTLKDSGISWLGDIPAHWTVERAKYVLQEVDERSSSGDEEQLSVSHLTGVSPRKSTVTMFRAESYIGHKVCKPYDLVVNTMWAWMGALGVARNAGIVSPSYGVYRLSGATKMRPEYLDLIVRTPRYVSYFKSESTGIRSSRLRLYPNQMLATPLLIPPLSEQGAIVGHVQTRVEEFEQIRSKALTEIELLREFRRRLTSDVVTGRLDVRVIAASLPDLSDELFAVVDDQAMDVNDSEFEFVDLDVDAND